MQSLVEFEIIAFLRNYCVMFLLGVGLWLCLCFSYYVSAIIDSESGWEIE